MFKKRKGFTLVELMVVAVIVAILAAVLVPLMTGNKKRAYETEAVAALGTIRNALRVYRAEHSDYKLLEPGLVVASGLPGISAGDLDGTFFSEDCYSIAFPSETTYTITCAWGINNDAPKSGALEEFATTQTTLDQDGNFVTGEAEEEPEPTP